MEEYSESHPGFDPVFDIVATGMIAAEPARIYAYVSDLRRSSEWSRECRGGEWIHGEPATAAAVFRGHNFRSAETVSWAPVVRGEWFTEARVVVADPPRLFSWAMCDSAGQIQDSVWSFRIQSSQSGVLLGHEFLMRSLTEGMREILGGLHLKDRQRFIDEWRAKLRADMSFSVGQITKHLETTDNDFATAGQ